jgi:hypothetical protein
MQNNHLSGRFVAARQQQSEALYSATEECQDISRKECN